MSGSIPKIKPFARSKGLHVDRYFTDETHDPYEGVVFRKVDAVILDWETKAETFRQNEFEVTAEHTDTDAAVIASRYARGTLGTPERESSLRQIVNRVVGQISDWGVKSRYFASNKDAIVFHEELTRILITRKAAFNSPVWFNLGVAGSKPQASACYCLSIDDTMESILDHCKVQGMVFKFGSGAGANMSRIRSRREHMSGGGRPSGPLSFMSGLDKFAGVIKSGGKVRRAALLRVLNEDHPDILDYVWCKVHEERKAAALIAGGFSGGFEGEAYSTVDYQNANNTCKVSDRTMAALKYGREHEIQLRAITTGKVLGTLPAKDLMEQIADAAWQCGDPGLHFDSIERANKVPSLGKIWTSNPCALTDMRLLSQTRGLVTILDVNLNEMIWTGQSWAPVTKKALTGVKPVFEIVCEHGLVLRLTEDHPVFARGVKVPIKDTDVIDLAGHPDGVLAGTTVKVLSRRALGEHPVMDITVDAPEHAYWSDGLLVSNCSEFVHVNDTSCNLASLNLREFQNEDGALDIEAYQAAIRILILAMEIIVDNAHYPTERIRHLTRLTRPLGLGYCNLGAFLMAAGLPYDSREARTLAFGITSLLTATAYHRSAEIARDHGGPFTVYSENRETMLGILETYAQSATEAGKTRSHVQAVDEVLAGALEATWAETLNLGRLYGYRNDESTAIAPTGTISFFMAADTTSCEPDMALVKYKTLAGGGSLKIVNRTVGAALARLGYSVPDVTAILAHIEKTDTIEGAPGLKAEHLPVFDCAFKAMRGERFISWQGHVHMMAALQEGVSMAISKTVNMPNSATKKDMLDAYVEAWNLGVKALAVFRDGSKGVQVVSTGQGEDKAQDKAQALPKAAQTMAGARTKITVGGTEGYVHTGHDVDGRIVEVFLTFTRHGSIVSGLMDTIAILISKDLRRGVPMTEILDSIRGGTFSPSGWTTIETSDGKSENTTVGSIVTAVCTWLMAEYPDGVWVGKGKILDMDAVANVITAIKGTMPMTQPTCGKCGAFKTPNGPRCWICPNCGDKEGGCG